jgi:hypothetical protein
MQRKRALRAKSEDVPLPAPPSGQFPADLGISSSSVNKRLSFLALLPRPEYVPFAVYYLGNAATPEISGD